MDWYHPSLGLMAASASFTLNGAQYPADTLRTFRPDGFLPVRVEPRPDDREFFVSEQIVTITGDEAVVSWRAVPRDPADIQAARNAETNTAVIARLEAVDRRKIRSLSAVIAAQLAGETPHPLDVATLTALETEAAALRVQLAG